MKRYELNHAKFLSDEEQSALLKVLDVNDRDGLFITLALKTGARMSELLNITAADVNERTQTVFISGLKGSNDREIPLEKSVLKALFARARGLPRDARVFPFCRQRVFQIWTMYRPNPNKGFHSLRHTFAVQLYKRFKDIMLVRTALGHRSLKNTMIYADFVYQTESLRKIAL